MEIVYLTQPPKRYTFEQPKLREWVEHQCRGKVLNLFAGRTKLNVDEYRVDIDKDVLADHYGDAFEFVSKTEMRFDTIILDPPWSIRKSREKYGGRVVGSFTKIKDVLRRILNKNGRVITVGYSSTGMSKSRGFKKIALAIVCHNGDHDDSFAIVEEDYEKDVEVIVEEKVTDKMDDKDNKIADLEADIERFKWDFCDFIGCEHSHKGIIQEDGEPVCYDVGCEEAIKNVQSARKVFIEIEKVENVIKDLKEWIWEHRAFMGDKADDYSLGIKQILDTIEFKLEKLKELGAGSEKTKEVDITTKARDMASVRPEIGGLVTDGKTSLLEPSLSEKPCADKQEESDEK